MLGAFSRKDQSVNKNRSRSSSPTPEGQLASNLRPERSLKRKDEVEALKHQLVQAQQSVIAQASTMRENDNEIERLRCSLEEAKVGNDELVNEIHDLMSDYNETNENIDSAMENDAALVSLCKKLAAEREQLVKLLDVVYEEYVHSDEVSEMIEKIREQIKLRLKAGAKVRRDLEKKLKDTMWQRNELNQTLISLATEKCKTDNRLQETIEIIHALKLASEELIVERENDENRLVESEGRETDESKEAPKHQSIRPEDGSCAKTNSSSMSYATESIKRCSNKINVLISSFNEEEDRDYDEDGRKHWL